MTFCEPVVARSDDNDQIHVCIHLILQKKIVYTLCATGYRLIPEKNVNKLIPFWLCFIEVVL